MWKYSLVLTIIAASAVRKLKIGISIFSDVSKTKNMLQVLIRSASNTSTANDYHVLESTNHNKSYLKMGFRYSKRLL